MADAPANYLNLKFPFGPANCHVNVRLGLEQKSAYLSSMWLGLKDTDCGCSILSGPSEDFV
jgi:hypothetical protein